MSSERQGPSWYFIDLRRRYINDRTWFGLGFLAIGVGALGPEASWWIGIPLAGLGVVLMVGGLRDQRR